MFKRTRKIVGLLFAVALCVMLLACRKSGSNDERTKIETDKNTSSIEAYDNGSKDVADSKDNLLEGSGEADSIDTKDNIEKEVQEDVVNDIDNGLNIDDAGEKIESNGEDEKKESNDKLQQEDDNGDKENWSLFY